MVVKTAEAVCVGHPDKLCDLIAESLLDRVLLRDASARCAFEVSASGRVITVMGEVSTKARLRVREWTRAVLAHAGYNPLGFWVRVNVRHQSPNIAQAVTTSLEAQGGDDSAHSMLGAGDQGTVYGYATSESEAMLPTPLVLAQDMCKRLDAARVEGVIKGIKSDGKPQVDPEQARVVRRIYSMFLSGYSYRQIATTFTNEGIPVPGVRGKRWHAATIKSILTNERYKGDALLQKTFIEDFLPKKQRRNEGQMPQYYVTGSHEAIIDPDTWELVQYEVKARKGRRTPFAFSMKLKCSVCGGWYGSKTWHSNDKYRSMIWQCNNKYNIDHPQGMPHPVDAELEAAFNAALHELLQARPIITATIENAINKTTDTTHLEGEISELALKVEGLQARIEKEIRANSKQAQDQTEYQKRFEELQTQYDEALGHYSTKASELEERNGKARQMRHILATLSQLENSPVGFDFRLWHVLVDHMLISPDGQIRVQWKWLPEVEKQ